MDAGRAEVSHGRPGRPGQGEPHCAVNGALWYSWDVGTLLVVAHGVAPCLSQRVQWCQDMGLHMGIPEREKRTPRAERISMNLAIPTALFLMYTWYRVWSSVASTVRYRATLCDMPLQCGVPLSPHALNPRTEQKRACWLITNSCWAPSFSRTEGSTQHIQLKKLPDIFPVPLVFRECIP